ncbi:MAG: signal peptidase II [Chloroflexi bacterium]|nr:signal peptidase II [Chloroflexota bacterium]
MKRWLFPILLALCIITDQAAKYWAAGTLKSGQIPLFGGAVMLNLTSNTGGAFGILPASPSFFTIAGALVFLVMVIFIKKITRLPYIYQVGLALVGGGAVGNLIDRLKMGYVIDFIDLKFWPVFNLADSYITIGVLILAYLFLTDKRREED